MFKVALKVPTEKFATLRANLQNMGQADGPLDLVGKYVATNGMFTVFSSHGEGTWKEVLRGGDPLDDEGELKRGFVYAMGSDGKSVVITNTGREEMIQWVENFGLTIFAKAGPFLRFKIGDQWVSKKSVTIPARAFFVWLAGLRASTVQVAKDALLVSVQAALS